MNFWETLAVALISSSSAILASFLTNRSNESRLRLQSELDSKKEFEKIRISKAEEIFKSAGKYKNILFKYHTNLVSHCRGEIPIKDVMVLDSDSTPSVMVIETGLAIYFPHLLTRFNKCRTILKPANSLYFKMVDNPRMGIEEKLGFVNIIFETGIKFDDELDSICQEMISYIRKD